MLEQNTNILKETLRSLILLELTRKSYAQVMDNLPDEPLPFDDELFGGSDRKRVLIPFVSEAMKEIGEFFTELGYETDLENGMSKTIQTQRGSKQVSARIGKVLNKEYDRLQKETEEFFQYFKYESPAGLDLTDTPREQRPRIRSSPHFSFKTKIMGSNFRYGGYTFMLDELEDIIKHNLNSTKQKLEDYDDHLFHYSTNEKEDKLKELLEELEDYQKMISNSIFKKVDLLYKTEKYIKKYNQEGSGLSILVSRAPVDVLRMSDHQNIQSCHSEGGSYWQCAIQEAKRGGAVAYLVKNDALKNVDLEAEEIFQDKDRGIAGITPISRIRLRRFENREMGYSIAVPEKRAYGSPIDGFLETLTAWSFDKQEDNFKDEEGNISEPNMRDFVLVGGSYRDNSASELFNNFFDSRNFYGDVENDSPEEGQAIADQYEEECAEFLRDFNEKSKHTGAHYEVEDNGEGQAYVSFFGSIVIDLGKSGIGSHQISWRDSNKLRNYISDELNEEHFEDINIETNYINFDVSRNDYDSTPDGFHSFLIDLLDYESKYSKLYNAVRQWLASEKEEEYPLDQIINNSDFENFDDVEFDENEIKIELSTGKIAIPDHTSYNDEEYRKNVSKLDDELSEIITKKIRNLIQGDVAQLFLPGIESIKPTEDPVSTNGFFAYIIISGWEGKLIGATLGFKFNIADEHANVSSEEAQAILSFMKYIDQNVSSLTDLTMEVAFSLCKKYGILK